MSLFPMKKKCENCHRKYSFNPDIGQIACPYCGGLNMGGDIINGIKDKKHNKERKKK